jgi:hypothetical protein
MTSSLLDTVLDRTVIGGYTSVGYQVRTRGWSASERPSLGGRVVMVTGSTSGSGSPQRTALRASARRCGWWSEAKHAVNRHAPQSSSDPAAGTYATGCVI